MVPARRRQRRHQFARPDGTPALIVAVPLALGVAARARWPSATFVHIGAPMIGNLALLVLVYLVSAQIPDSTAYLPITPERSHDRPLPAHREDAAGATAHREAD